MKIKSVFSHSFNRYGKVITGYDVSELLKALGKTDKPADSVIYEPFEKGLEACSVVKQMSTNIYGGMNIQAGFCNGNNTKLNCLEWHRGSEINIPEGDIVLLLADLRDVKNGKLDTSKVEAFAVPAGTVVEIYETTLHYAPCNGAKAGKVSRDGFRVVIILPEGTNFEKPEMKEVYFEDKLLWAKNKWLIAHPDSSEAKAGAFAGLTGNNIDIAKN